MDRWAVPLPGRLSRAFLAWLLALTAAFSVGQELSRVAPDRPPPTESAAPAAAPLVDVRQLPVPAQALVSQTVGEGDAAYHLRGLRARNPAQQLTATFAPDGVTVRAGGDRLRLAMRGAAVEPVADLNRVEYHRDGYTEWYANGPLGLEQGFTLRRPLGAPLRLAVSGTLAPRLVGGDVAFGDVLSLRGLYAEDADGQPVPARFELDGRALLVHVDDRSARYPVTVDPFLEEARVTAYDGMPDDRFGITIGLAGNTLVVGAPLDEKVWTDNASEGSAYVFVRVGASWSLQKKLTPSDPGVNQYFGTSVAIEGDTAVIGATGAAGGAGAAYVFERTGTTWSEQTKLTASDGVAADSFGGYVAISGDTVAALASNAGHTPGFANGPGAVYVFTRSGEVWSQQAKLTASEGGLLRRLALDGDTIVAGGHSWNPSRTTTTPVVYVFARGGTSWAQQAILTVDAPIEFGGSVDVAGDTIVAGEMVFDIAGATRAGAAYIFVRRGGSWTQQARLLNPEPATDDFFGSSVAIRGNTAAVGAIYDDYSRGSVFVFVRSGVVWTERVKLSAADSGDVSPDYVGSSVAVSGDAVATGAHEVDTSRGSRTGAAYVFPFAESDGDGLLDSWETDGFDADGDGTIDVDLPAMGADPDHKDVFVEIDSMAGHKLSQAALDIVVDSFAAAPVSNPDGTTGITLHIDNGATSVMDPVFDLTWGELSDADTLTHEDMLGSWTDPDTYNWSEFDAFRDTFFQDARRRVFHYAISAHDISVDHYSGVARDIPASNLIVSLGSFCTPGQECSGSVTAQAGTFMHELGHDLGLGHGGGDHRNNKPNYFSVMNYNHQLNGLILVGTNGPGFFDYSSFTAPTVDPIDETNLDETKSFGHGAELAYWSVYRCPEPDPAKQPPRGQPRGVDPLRDSVDWNCDGDSTDTALAADVNGDGFQGTLHPFDDWSHIVFTGGSIGELGATLPADPVETTVTEPTMDELISSAATFDAPEKLSSSTALSIHDAGHDPVTVVEAGSAVHALVTVTGQPSSPVPTGDVTIDRFSNGSCSGDPVETGGPFALAVDGQVDATAFSSTVGVGQRSFLAHYAGDEVYYVSDGTCEALAVVDANVQIAPTTATNAIGTNQPLTITVDASGGLLDPGPHTATASISSGPGSFVGSPSCTYTGGGATASCQVTVTSAVVGTTEVSATADIPVEGVVVERATGTAASSVWFQPNRSPIATVSGGQCSSTEPASGTIKLRLRDADGDPLTFGLVSNSNPSLLPAGDLALGGTGSSRTLAVAAADGRRGSATLTFDLGDGTATVPVVVTVLVGTKGEEILDGTAATDMIFGRDGRNTLKGGGGNDLLCGGASKDALAGGDGDDTLTGGNRADALNGGAGNDVLRGGLGSDTLTGRTGADSFSGGAGEDTATDLTPAEGDTTDGTIP